MDRTRTPEPPPTRSAPLVQDRPARRLRIPARLPASLGYDAVGTLREHGERILASLPRIGCVFADDRRWWWIVPADSHVGVDWPPGVRYSVGARLADPSWTPTRPKPAPHLIHAPDAGSPYTPPIPLYFLACRLTGSAPRWSLTLPD
ncbi:hypothetical protein [Streptomyces broussonetiae]|uniref:DUF3024 domain-containing protein n=1 Tax=Streptomyces broussonetiae TaxID=2686304 RepID=A0ABV5ECY5_9ACTN